MLKKTTKRTSRAAVSDRVAHLTQSARQRELVAVIGTGADIVYPARNRPLAHRIAAEGCILSEYPLGMPAIAAKATPCGRTAPTSSSLRKGLCTRA